MRHGLCRSQPLWIAKLCGISGQVNAKDGAFLMSAANRVSLAPGLYFLATPIGTARDITLRSLDILASADVLAAEDTRALKRLMAIHGIGLEGRRVLSYHDHSKDNARTALLAALEAGKSVAYASEAGTPLIADPGFQLSRAAAQAGHLVTAAPGPSAMLAALTIAGLPTDRFLFAGFLPSANAARKRALAELKQVPATLVFYEAPGRVAKCLTSMVEVFGPDRPAVIARELTKKFEEVLRGSLGGLSEDVAGRSLKGEVVLLVGAGETEQIDDYDLEKLLIGALKTKTVRESVAEIVEVTGAPKRSVYQMALALKKANE